MKRLEDSLLRIRPALNDMLCGGAANLVAHTYITFYGFAKRRYPLSQPARVV